MHENSFRYYSRHLASDIPAGVSVFLVALPLCLGIALASGVPLFSGLISGIVGGVLVSWFSGSQLSVSGPAAGLVVVVISAIASLGSLSAFLVASLVAGVFQLFLGFARAGNIAAYFPSTVIKGMLTSIGLLLIFKQFPIAIGYAPSDTLTHQFPPEEPGRMDWLQVFEHISAGAIMVSLGALLILLLWETSFIKRKAMLSMLPGPLIVVLWGVGADSLSKIFWPQLAATQDQLVRLPEITSTDHFLQQISVPDFTHLSNPDIYLIAATLAIVASLETLLNLEAIDKLDPLRRIAPTNRELKAQGFGNIVSSLLGGLPITSVIVRSSANVNAGAQTKMASFIHGILLLASIVFLSPVLNQVPLACLAAILLHTGYKLAKPSVFAETFRNGWSQSIPFVVTIAGILLTDLLKGIGIGLIVCIYFIIHNNYRSVMSLTKHERHYLLRFHKDVSFVSKVELRSHLASIEENYTLIIDGSRAHFIDHDIRETIFDFVVAAADSNITVELRDIPERITASSWHPPNTSRATALEYPRNK